MPGPLLRYKKQIGLAQRLRNVFHSIVQTRSEPETFNNAPLYFSLLSGQPAVAATIRIKMTGVRMKCPLRGSLRSSYSAHIG